MINKADSTLRPVFERIRDERRTAANTASRIGNAFLAIIPFLDRTLDIFLSKVEDDRAEGFIEFMQGLKSFGTIFLGEYAEGLAGGKLTEEGYAELESLWVRTFGKFGDGLQHQGPDGHDLPALQVDGDATFSRNLSSTDFVSAFFGGLGWAIQKKEVTNAAGTTEYKYQLEIDDVTVRNTLRVFEMIISQLLGENANRYFSDMMEVDHYDPSTGKVWLKTGDGKLYNSLRVGDIVVVQQYNGEPTLDNDWYVTKAYEFRVTAVGVGDLSLGENRLDWLEFENFTSPQEGLTPESAFRNGDTLVRADNDTNPDRKGIVSVMAVGPNTPYIDVLYGMKTDAAHALKSRMGNLQGIHTDLFGWLEGFGQYVNNLYGVGKFFNAQTGESLNASIQATREQLKSVYKETVYDISDEQNFLTNGFFTRELDGWERCAADGGNLPSEASSVIGINEGTAVEPMLFNGVMISEISTLKAEMADREGMQVLHLRSAGIRQSFANIKPNGTHKELASNVDEDNTNLIDVANPLFFGIRILPITSGQLSVHFVKGNEYTGFEYQVNSSLYWQLYQTHDIANLPWDYTGNGKLVISYTGECYIRFVTLTNDPVADAKTEYSTMIRQTSRVISLQARRLSGDIDDAVAEMTVQYNGILSTVTTNKSRSDAMLATILGITVNNDGTYTIPAALSGDNMATWRLATDGVIEDIAAKWDSNGNLIGYSTTEQTAAAISEAVSESADGTLATAQGYVNTLKGLINSDVLKDGNGNFGYSTFKTQTQNSINALAGNWDSNGNLIGYSTTEQTAAAIKTKVESYNYITAASLPNMANYYTKSEIDQTANGIRLRVKAVENDYVTSADISAFITDEAGKTLSNIKLKADRLDFNVGFDWVVKNANQETIFRLDNNGNLTLKGEINGGSIKGTLSVASNMELSVSGTKFARFASTVEFSAMLALRHDGGSCIEIGSYDYGTGIKITANTGSTGILAYGPEEFYVRTDEYFQIQNGSGVGFFAPGCCVKNASFTLPANPKNGTMFFLHGALSYNGSNQDLVVTTRSHPIMQADGRGNTVNANSSYNFNDDSVILVFFSAINKWVVFKCW